MSTGMSGYVRIERTLIYKNYNLKKMTEGKKRRKNEKIVSEGDA